MVAPGLYPVHGVIHYGPGGFSVHADRNAKYRPNGPSDYAKCIRKYRIGASQYTPFYFDEHRACVCHCKQPGKTNTLGNIAGNVRIPSIENDPVNQDPDDGMTIIRANDIQNDTEYACPVTIGSPGVTLTLDFDTGSSDFWVWSSEFRASRAQLEGHQIYNPHKSRTAESLPGATWEIGYGDGSHASGNVVMDTIAIGDITIKRQAVEVAQNLSDEFLRGGSDGLLGLAFPKLNTVRPHQQKTPMQNMVEQGLVKDPIFTVKLDKHDSRGYYTFGYINEHVHASKLYWQKVITDNGWWEVVSPYVRIGSKIYNRGRSNTAIIDTGTTLILIDDETIERLYSQIPGATLDRSLGGYIFPTNTRVPELAFCVGRWLFTVPSKDLAFSDAGNGMSYGAIQSRGQNKQDILGDVFLKHVYVVFDQGKNPRVSAQLRPVLTIISDWLKEWWARHRCVGAPGVVYIPLLSEDDDSTRARMILSDIYPTDGVLHFRPEGFSVRAHRNAKHRPHGPSAYAKSIKKYKIGATNHTPFFFDEVMACVWHHKHSKRTKIHTYTPGEACAPLVDLDSDDGMSIVQAEDIQNDSEYACPVTIGTPGVTLTLDFDTGSSDFWVWSSEFRATRAQLEGHQIYNPDKSRTAERLPGATWKISYGDGSSASGDVILDTVMIGDIKIKRQAVELSRHLSDEFLKGGSDGLLGLAFPKLNTVQPYQQKTPMQNMVEQGLVKEPIFSVKLDKHDSRGYYTFGYINEHIHASQLYWREVITDNGLWEVASPESFVSSEEVRTTDLLGAQDTGTTLILMDDETIKHLYSQIPGAKLDRSIGGYVFPTDARVPKLAFCVGRWLFTVPSEDLAFSDAGNGMSYGAIQSRGQNKQDILGDVFLKHVYVVFDQGANPRIGVAQR